MDAIQELYYYESLRSEKQYQYDTDKIRRDALITAGIDAGTASDDLKMIHNELIELNDRVVSIGKTVFGENFKIQEKGDKA